jgi:hypothetical protein
MGLSVLASASPDPRAVSGRLWRAQALAVVTGSGSHVALRHDCGSTPGPAGNRLWFSGYFGTAGRWRQGELVEVVVLARAGGGWTPTLRVKALVEQVGEAGVTAFVYLQSSGRPELFEEPQ